MSRSIFDRKSAGSRLRFSPLCAALGAAGLLLALPAGAEDPLAQLAPAGPCAEPREAVHAAPAPGGSSFSVVGPLQSFFNPADVAAEVGAPQRPVPSIASAVVRPGVCDQPGTGCGAFDVLGNPPIVPGVRPKR